MDATQTNTATEAPRFAHRLEAWGAAFLAAVFGLLPLDCASALGGAAQPFEFRDSEAVVIGKRSRADKNSAERP